MKNNTQLTGFNSEIIINNNLEAKVKSGREKTKIRLEPGKSAITMQGGYLYPIMYKEVLAGEYIHEYKIENITRILTPLVPTLDKLYVTIQAHFVPHTAIWENAEKIIAGKNEEGNPGYNSNQIPYVLINSDKTKKQNFKEMLISRYGIPNDTGNITMNVLTLRGYRKIYNNFIRNKEYEPALIEWKDDTVTASERAAVNGTNEEGQWVAGAYRIESGQTRKSYLTNVKKDITMTADVLNDNYELNEHLDWQTRYMDQKQKIENANKNDWDIIAEMGGTSPVTADRVQLLGTLDYELNYQQITQSTPEINESSPLGTTGAFSYTKANGIIFSHKDFKQHGFIHILISLNTDKLYENSINKELLKLSENEIYRPGLAKIETQVLYKGEISANKNTAARSFAAYQPPWAEYKRMPNLISGEMRSTKLLPTVVGQPEPITQSQWHNIPNKETEPTVSAAYFNNAIEVNAILQRNNILDLTYSGTFYDDPILNMSEHVVTTSLPIEESTVKATQKAEITR